MPIRGLIFLEHASQGRSDEGEVLDEASVDVTSSEEASHLLDVHREGGFSNTTNRFSVR